MGRRLDSLKNRAMESTGTAAYIELCGRGELLLTGCRSLCDFSDELVFAKTVSGNIRIFGRSLCVAAFRGDLLIVKGQIDKIDFTEGECLC